MTERLRRYAVEFALVAVAAVWGGTFVMVKDAVERYPLYGFLGWRFAIAVVAFVLLFPKSLRRFRKGTVSVGVLAGVLLCAGYIFQTWGLQYTNPSKAAFITGMFVVITPVLQFVILRRAPRWTTLTGVGAAIVGGWLLSGASGGGWNVGDTSVLLCALSYSLHMIVLGGVGHKHDVLALTLMQLVTTAVICTAISLAFEPRVAPTGTDTIVALLVTGVLASAVAFAVQTYAQRHLSPTRTALILIMEPVFGGVFGYFLAGDRLGARGWAGAALIFAGMVISEILAAMRFDGEKDAVLEPNLEGPPAPVLEPQE